MRNQLPVRSTQFRFPPRGTVPSFAFLCNPPLCIPKYFFGRQQLAQIDAVLIGVSSDGIEFSWMRD
jgi:hypothetical protein